MARIKKSLYEAELLRLQGELVALQEWVKDTGQRVVVIFEGRDAAGKGGTITRITEYLNPRDVGSSRCPRRASRERTQWYFQRYVAAPSGRRRDRALRPLLVQPRRGRAGHGLLHACRAPAVPAAVPDLRADAGRRRDPAAQVLVLGQRRGAGAPLRLPGQRSAAVVEVHRERPAHPREVGGVLPRQGRDVRPHRPRRVAVVRRRGRRQAARPAEHDRPPALHDPLRPQDRPPLELPPRPPAADYQRPPRELFRAVPDHAGALAG